MARSLKYILVVILVITLVAIRHYQVALFYDPLLDFFKSDFINAEFPSFDIKKHLLSISGRYWLNSFLSIAVLGLLFSNKLVLKLSGLIYLIIFILSLCLYYYFIATEFRLGFTAGFYVRRILMQPILLLLLIPAFWYIEKQR